MKPRNRFDKAGIDNESKSFFGNLDKNCFKLINTDDHSKILICDEDFMIMGSFNWLSFGGGNENLCFFTIFYKKCYNNKGYDLRSFAFMEIIF